MFHILFHKMTKLIILKSCNLETWSLTHEWIGLYGENVFFKSSKKLSSDNPDNFFQFFLDNQTAWIVLKSEIRDSVLLTPSFFFQHEDIFGFRDCFGNHNFANWISRWMWRKFLIWNGTISPPLKLIFG